LPEENPKLAFSLVQGLLKFGLSLQILETMPEIHQIKFYAELMFPLVIYNGKLFDQIESFVLTHEQNLYS